MCTTTIISTQIEIEAPIENVWSILSDFDHYSEWNKFTHRVDTDQVIGNTVMLHIQWLGTEKTFQQATKLTKFEEGKHICWGASFTPSCLLKTNRRQTLEFIDQNRTRYVTSEKFHGSMAPLVMLLYRKKIEAAFEHVAQALKKHTESS
mmetsp:Transcript_21814/g.32347  ORF Transcript_21814/g.32347 Transcript_21814/m.32347 type:complete len:149 (-) Transcript_21814:438-884(-)